MAETGAQDQEDQPKKTEESVQVPEPLPKDSEKQELLSAVAALPTDSIAEISNEIGLKQQQDLEGTPDIKEVAKPVKPKPNPVKKPVKPAKKPVKAAVKPAKPIVKSAPKANSPAKKVSKPVKKPSGANKPLAKKAAVQKKAPVAAPKPAPKKVEKLPEIEPVSEAPI